MIATARDHKTSQTVSGVYLKAGHWAASTVHAFRHWTGETTLKTWCGIEANLADGARHTTEIINCVQCGQASLIGMRADT